MTDAVVRRAGLCEENEPPSPPTKRLSAGRQLNAIFALALLAAPSVRGCPMKVDIAIFLSEARFKANGGDFFAGADNRPSRNLRFPARLIKRPEHLVRKTYFSLRSGFEHEALPHADHSQELEALYRRFSVRDDVGSIKLGRISLT
jgi:hypothetical protein